MRGRLSLICLGLLAWSSLPARPTQMLLELCVNDRCYGNAFVMVRDEHILVEKDALESAHVDLGEAKQQAIGATQFIDVSASAHVTKVQVDDSAGRLFLTLDAGAFEGHRIDLNPRAGVLQPTGAVPSAFVNYSLGAGTGSSSAAAYLDAGFAYGQGLLRESPSWNQYDGFARGLTRFEYDDVGRMQRLTIGDQYAFSSDGLGGTALLGGIGLVRAFDLDPYLITFPQPTLSGLLQAPGTIDVYENGVLVAQRQVPAGPFNLASLGLGAGGGNVRVVVQDPFGGTTVLQQNVYSATQLLAKGLSDYAYQVGVERTSTLVDGYEGGHGVLLLRDNYGFTDSLTAGYRLEAENSIVNAGPSASFGFPFGVVTAAVAASDASGAQGYGGSLAYQYNGHAVSFASGIQSFSDNYRRIGDDLLPVSLRVHRTGYANFRWTPMARLSLQALAASTTYDDETRQRNAGLDATLNLPQGLMVTFGVNRQRNTGPGLPASAGVDNQVFLNVVMAMGRDSVGINVVHDEVSGSSYGISAQRSVPSDNGWGYSVNAQNSSQGTFGMAQAQYQGRDGLAQLSVQRLGDQTTGSALVSGSLVALDDHVYAGRALQNGYALIETGDVAGVKVTRENQPIGETDADGTLLVTNLLPYQANKVGIDQSSVSLTNEIDATSQLISVPRLGGTVVKFGVHALHAAHGVLMFEGKALQYGTATLSVQDVPKKTLVGLDGSFYFADLPAGRYTLHARSPQGEVNCPLTMSAGAQTITDLGTLLCRLDAGAGP
jgi:outer membrane usher protein